VAPSVEQALAKLGQENPAHYEPRLCQVAEQMLPFGLRILLVLRGVRVPMLKLFHSPRRLLPKRVSGKSVAAEIRHKTNDLCHS
jgi:hypothetical protein